MILEKFEKSGLIHPPKWLKDNCAYLTIMGSTAYGVNKDDSDFDIYGFAIPPKEIAFPHLGGKILGFGTQAETFNQWSEHHIKDPDGKDREYDFTVRNIIKFFDLLMAGNPDITDSIWTPINCVIHSTAIGNMVRENRQMFLSKLAWPKYKGYAFAQMSKVKSGSNRSNPKRAADIEEHGFDLKFCYHIVRLLNEIEQILMEGELDLLRNREQLKSIRRGEWSLEEIQTYFDEKERSLELLFTTSKLRMKPDEGAIKTLLLNCLEQHYGTLSQAVVRETSFDLLKSEMQAVLNKYA